MSFVMSNMNFNVQATLVKPNPKNAGTSTWQFGRLANGWYGCKSLNSDKRIYFDTAAKMDACLGKFISKYGYTVACPEQPEPDCVQLSLAV